MIVDFPAKEKRKPLNPKDIEMIRFITNDLRDLCIMDKDDIAKIMALIVREKITIYEEK